MSKNDLLVLLMTFLNFFQFPRLLVVLYLSRDWPHSSVHYCLECFMILNFFAFLVHACFISTLSWLTVCSKLFLLIKLDISRFLKINITSLIKVISYLLFCRIDDLEVLTISSAMGIVIVRETWLEERWLSGWIECLSSSLDLYRRNIRLIIKFASPIVSKYLVGQGLVDVNKAKLNESTIIMRSSLIKEWWGKDVSYRLSLMLKFLIITRTLSMFTLVSLRYFKAVWEESEYTFIM